MEKGDELMTPMACGNNSLSNLICECTSQWRGNKLRACFVFHLLVVAGWAGTTNKIALMMVLW